MTETLSTEAFHALHPFSYETDGEGFITRIGRSLQKAFPDISVSSRWDDVFELTRQFAGHLDGPLSSLPGEVICLVNKRDPRMRLRGQVVKIAENPERYIFSLLPSLWRASQLAEFGLDITDFEAGTVIFDFLLYSQAQVAAREKAQEAKERLEWDVKISRLLHQLTLDTYAAADIQEAYRVTIDSVCTSLDWEVGHVLVRAGPDSDYLISSGIWYVADQKAYRDLRSVSEGYCFAVGQGLPGKVLEERGVLWVRDAARADFFVRRKAIEKLSSVSAIAAPVIIENRVEAIMEFFTRRNALEQETSHRFFEVLGIQLSRLAERFEGQRRETERLAMLAQSSKMATLGEIAAGIAHEINNPVSTISLVGQIIKRLAQKGPISLEDISPQVNRLDLCVGRIAKIVSELRSFSRDAPNDGFQPESLSRIVEETLDLCHARFASGNIAIRISDIDPSWHAECRGSQISQVLLNLLSNSFDAVCGMNQAWIEISVADRGEQYEIAVMDSGSGVPDTIAENMMKPFFTTKPLGKGTGLGLSISSNIMIDHRGSLRLDRSSPHTRFVITLPKRYYERPERDLEAVGV